MGSKDAKMCTGLSKLKRRTSGSFTAHVCCYRPYTLTGWQLGEHAEWGKHTNWELASMFSLNGFFLQSFFPAHLLSIRPGQRASHILLHSPLYTSSYKIVQVPFMLHVPGKAGSFGEHTQSFFELVRHGLEMIAGEVDTCHRPCHALSFLVHLSSRFFTTAFRSMSTRRLCPQQVFLWRTLRMTWTAWVRRLNLSALSVADALALSAVTPTIFFA